MNAKDLIELLRKLPKGSKITLQRKDFETIFFDSDPKQRAETIARLNICTLDPRCHDHDSPGGAGG
jgi:hypothetical protein